MKNPLEQFFPVEERPDGVYIRVNRAKRDSVSFDTVIRVLEQSLVVNLEQQFLKDVFQRARGAFERIGPPFEYYDPELEKHVQIAITPVKASVKVSSGCLLLGKKLTAGMLFFYLARKGVKHGIKTDLIERIVKDNIYDSFVDIAEATSPVHGKDAQIELKISVSPDSRPQLRNNGSVNYRDVQTFTSVSKGQVIAIKIPPTPGNPGYSVYGEPIPSVGGSDKAYPCGKNTEITPDGKTMVASKTGIIYQEGELLHVAEVLHISGDVDFSIGNIKYSGDVLISGNVLPGFSVESDGDVHIKGDVESARIVSRNGKVIVERGIIGKGDTRISAKSGIQVCFAQETIFQTDGTVTFDRYLLHCTVMCESLEATATNSSIIGGKVSAEKQVIIRNLGSEKGIATTITLFDKQKMILEEKIQKLQELEGKLRVEMEPVEKQLRTKAAMLRRNGDDISDRTREEVKKWIDAHNSISKKINYVQQNIEALKSEINNPKTYSGFIQVSGTVFPGVLLDMYGSKLSISSQIAGKRFRQSATDGVETEG